MPSCRAGNAPGPRGAYTPATGPFLAPNIVPMHDPGASRPSRAAASGPDPDPTAQREAMPSPEVGSPGTSAITVSAPFDWIRITPIESVWPLTT